jgi:photosystem II stability/assembly factor-like uncharacterized protein
MGMVRENHRGEQRLRTKLCLGILVGLIWGAGCWGQAWERLGPEGGMVVSLAANVTGRLYLGTTDGHIFVRERGANKWELRGRVGSRMDAVVTHLECDPREEERIFAAVWYQEAGAGGGIFESVDGGRTWKPVGLEGEAVRALELAPGPQEIFVAGTRSGIFRSADEGKTWERISPAGDVELRNVDSVAIDPEDSNVIYAGTYHLPWKTIDGGKSWKPVVAGLIDDSDVMSLRVDATNPERVYLSACSGIYRSENRGGQWTKLQGIPYAARRTHAIAQDPQNPQTLYAGTTEGLWVTRDAGENWKRTTPKDWVVNAVLVLPARQDVPQRVYLGTEAQGVQMSEDAGESFASANKGFTHTVVRQLVGGQNAKLLALFERGGQLMEESRDAGNTWTRLPVTGDGPQKVSLQDAGAIEEVFASPWGWLARQQSGQLRQCGESQGPWKEFKLRLVGVSNPWPSRKGAAPGKKTTTVPAIVKRVGPAIAFSQQDLHAATDQGFLRCTSAGACTQLRAFGRSRDASALWVSPDGLVLAAVVEGKLALSLDSGETANWRDLPAGIRAVRWMDVEKDSEKTRIFLGTAEGVYASGDGDVGWKREKNGLPGGPVDQWLRDGSVFVATMREGGIYVSRDQGASWTRVDQDAERGRITGIVRAQAGVWLMGSQSEGILQLETGATK